MITRILSEEESILNREREYMKNMKNYEKI